MKDVPDKKIWFRRKLYGWGWTPVAWQGWAVIGGFAAVLVALSLSLDKNSSPKEIAFMFLLPAAVLTASLICIAYKTGERPRWQWGYQKPFVIAEVKTRSPFGFTSEKSWDDLFAIALQTGDMISIHTDPRWGGSLDLVRKARSLTRKPILAKGIHANDKDIEDALAAGADKVLVVGRVPKIHADKCLVEPNTIAELKALPRGIKAVWNSRDLSSGGLKSETFAAARTAFRGWLCQASNIRTMGDVHPDADAVLVGTHIEEFAASRPARRGA